MGKKITIKDIAKIAGVSVSTVSNILNERYHKVNVNTKEKILNIMNELNYKPDFTARSLSNGKSKLIGMIMPINNTREDANENPFYFEYMLGVEKIAKFMDYDIIVSENLKKREYTDFVKKRNLDGIILVGRFNEDVYYELEELGKPLVSIDHPQSIVKNAKNILSDNYFGGNLAAEHFISMGHKKIGLISGVIDSFGICKDRYEGFRDRLAKENIYISEENIAIEAVSYYGGINSANKLLNKEITAIFATSDIMALGAMKVFLEAGKKIPEDISILGFDDVGMCRYIIPELSSIRQNIFLKGEMSAKVLIEMINGSSKENSDLIIPVDLVKRKSVLNL